jgi:Skp family chaperone for outer membrane proteins
VCSHLSIFRLSANKRKDEKKAPSSFDDRKSAASIEKRQNNNKNKHQHYNRNRKTERGRKAGKLQKKSKKHSSALANYEKEVQTEDKGKGLKNRQEIQKRVSNATAAK